MNNAQKLNAIDIERLVQASQRGNREAFDKLVRIYQCRTMQVAVGILGNADDAAEAVQAGFVKGYLSIKKLRKPERFEAWLLRIVANSAISQRKIAKRRMEIMKTIDIRRGKEWTFPPANTEDSVELNKAIQQAMSKLSKKQAQAISLFGLKDLSHKEVAEIMGCSVEAVRWYVFKAREKLKVLLKEYLQ